jgi:hypothetical protein
VNRAIASRTTGVVLGGVAGIPGGPPAMFAGGVAGGAAMDGIITGASSAVEGKFTPYGQIASWNAVAKGNSADEVVGGVVGGIMAPVLDGVAGVAAGAAVKGIRPTLNEIMVVTQGPKQPASVSCGVAGGIAVEEIFAGPVAAECIAMGAAHKVVVHVVGKLAEEGVSKYFLPSAAMEARANRNNPDTALKKFGFRGAIHQISRIILNSDS